MRGGIRKGDGSFGGFIQGFRGAIATEHYLSAQAGMEMLKQGGNAFDAAAAATLVETVVNPHMVTIGGECPMLLYSPKQNRVVSVNGNTQAPASATLEAYLDRGIDLVPGDGILTAGVPACFSALGGMLIEYGSLPFEIIVEPALGLAREGFPLHEGILYMDHFSLTVNRDKFLDRWPGTVELYLEKDGSVPKPGKRFRNPALADMFDQLRHASRKKSGNGRKAGIQAALDLFYHGDVAGEIVAFSDRNDGFLSRSDLAQFETRFEQPLSVSFADTVLYKCGPWSQGPVFLQLLQLLGGYNLKALQPNSADYLHLWIETTKLAYADREQYYADPTQVNVPMEELLSDSYADKRRRLIDPASASGDHRPGDPIRGNAVLPEGEIFRAAQWGFGTVHVAAIDDRGNMAALTPSGAWLQGNEVIPALGFPLPSRLQTFWLDPRHPNVLAPGKRPRTTLSPSLAFRHGKPWMVFGTMGGDQQDQWTSQFFLNRIVFGMELQDAIEAPKITCDHIPGTFHPHDAFPLRVRAEERIPAPVVEELNQRGHQMQSGSDWVFGYVCAVEVKEDGLLTAGSDPRGRKASVFPSCALAW